MDTFDIDCGFVGPVQRVNIEHDNSGPGPAWFLDKVVIDDIDHRRKYVFPCKRWLDKEKDDGAISRDLAAGGDFDIDFDGDIDVDVPGVSIDLTGPKVKKPKGKFDFGFGGKDKKKKEKKEKKPKEKEDRVSVEGDRKSKGFSFSLPTFGFKKGDKKVKGKAGLDASFDSDVVIPALPTGGDGLFLTLLVW